MKEHTQSLSIHLEGISLNGILTIPNNAKGIVIFSHGSGSGRLSPRNNYVAQVLNRKGLATLLADLLTEEEDWLTENRFDIDLLTHRLIAITKWVKQYEETKGLPIFYFGASTGAASALKASLYFYAEIQAIVSRGGRPDLIFEKLNEVQAPTLLIVGGLDSIVLKLNSKAYVRLKCEKDMEIVPDASHLFEEPGKLEEVAQLAALWFLEHVPLKNK